MNVYFAFVILLGFVRALAVLLARAGAALVLVLLLAGAGVQTQAAPARSQAQACTEANAAYVLRERVERELVSNGARISVPAGVAAAWSCVSRAAAEAELARQIANIR